MLGLNFVLFELVWKLARETTHPQKKEFPKIEHTQKSKGIFQKWKETQLVDKNGKLIDSGLRTNTRKHFYRY